MNSVIRALLSVPYTHHNRDTVPVLLQNRKGLWKEGRGVGKKKNANALTQSSVACNEHYSPLVDRFAQPVRADVLLCEGGESRYVLDADYYGTRAYTFDTSRLWLGVGVGVADEVEEYACEIA